jgi:LL-diaminopimelate aminotransferase
MGSKSALSYLPQAFINPRDITLMTVPGYPILGTITKWVGGEVYPLLLTKENNYLPKLSEIPFDIRRKAKLLYLNYPNNPTGAVASKEFFEEVVEFARENHILVLQDAAYGALVFGNNKPLSFLSIPGAKEVGIELHSMSKAFNMSGWRLGFIAGNEKAVKAIAMVKDNNDSGQFRAIQKAGCYALQHPGITVEYCRKYERRHHKLVALWKQCGFTVTEPSATFYEYVKIPKGTKDGQVFETAEGFSDYLIRKAKISTVPWDDAGAYFRVSVTFSADTLEQEDEVLCEIHRRIDECGFIF